MYIHLFQCIYIYILDYIYIYTHTCIDITWITCCYQLPTRKCCQDFCGLSQLYSVLSPRSWDDGTGDSGMRICGAFGPQNSSDFWIANLDGTIYCIEILVKVESIRYCILLLFILFIDVLSLTVRWYYLWIKAIYQMLVCLKMIGNRYNLVSPPQNGIRAAHHRNRALMRINFNISKMESQHS